MTATEIVGAKTCKATFGILCLEMMNPGISALSRLKQIEPSLEDLARQPETGVDSLESAKVSTILEVQSVSMLPHVKSDCSNRPLRPCISRRALLPNVLLSLIASYREWLVPK